MVAQDLYKIRARHSKQTGAQEYVVSQRTAQSSQGKAWSPIQVCNSREAARAYLDTLQADGPLYPPVHKTEWFHYMTRQFNVTLAWRLIRPGRPMHTLDVAQTAPA